MAIQQKLQTKLAQKLILTPSLQQAIKLLPMSTLELADLLNQEVVENPLLEEVPTEELQAADTQPVAEKEPETQTQQKNDTWDDQDYEYFFGEYLDDGYRPRAPQEVKELPPIENTLSIRSPITSVGSSRFKPTTSSCGKLAKPSSATWTTMAIWWRRLTKSPTWDRGRSRKSSARSSCCKASIRSASAPATCRNV
jgi:hypothetical protein